MPTVKQPVLSALALGLLVCSSPAFADEVARSESAPPTEIVTDQERGTVTIVIDGKPVMQIDANGLQVVGDVTYGGMLTDAGREHVAKTIAGGDDAR
ncbi:MAG: hypothetical protein EOM20_18840 [Spartobacteria bacterium]|nr:hypothetical protein [Spartobacteria bacterium]